MNRSPFFYVGDKYKLLEQIIPLFPKRISRFIEPFVGGGSVFLNVTAQSYLLNDINAHLIELHRFCFLSTRSNFIDQLENTIKEYRLQTKADYIKMREDYNKDKDQIKLYALLVYGFNRMLRFNQSEEFNLPFGNLNYNQSVKKSLEDYFAVKDEKEVTFFALDYKEFLSSLNLQKDDFCYFDPPYLLANSEYNKNWKEKDEIELLACLDTLNELGIKFAVSNVLYHANKSNWLLIKWARKYNVKVIKSNYISFRDNTKKKTVEVLITNYSIVDKSKSPSTSTGS